MFLFFMLWCIIESLQQAATKGTVMDDPKLIPQDTWQTQSRGTNDAEYEIYKTNAEQLGWKVKSYEEWLQQ